MNIIDVLHGEHRVLLKLFDWAEDLVTARSDIGIVGETAKMVSHTLLSHARQEEEVLFDALEPLLGNIGPMAVKIHRAQHRELEKRFGEAKVKPVVDIEILKDAIRMCREHFNGEETILFVLARRVLVPEELDKLGVRLVEGWKK